MSLPPVSAQRTARPRDEAPVRVVHAALSLRASYGGPARSIPALADALAAEGCAVEIVTAANGTASDPLILPADPRVTVTQVPGLFDAKGLALWTPAFKRIVTERLGMGGPVVLHDHGLWRGTNHAMATLAASLRVPLLVSPRGMLEGAALGHRALRKRAAWALYARRDLARARALHATSAAEADTLGALGLGLPVAMIPNGVALPAEAPPVGADRPHRQLLFLGRLHAVKGLTLLVDAWTRAAPPGWRLVIAGPAEDGYDAVLTRAIAQAGVGASVTLVGALDAAAAQQAIVASDVLVLPSLTESFGAVVAEALAAARPVIATTTTPWSAIDRAQCGWCAEPTPEALAAAITASCVHADDALRAAMGARGRAWVAAEFGWPRIAHEMMELYGWLARGGAAPPSVRRA